MTRFARSKGSKASNERVPENATPWQVMKNQLEEKKQEALENKKRKVFEESRMENYKSFLEEKENDIKSEWVEFEEQGNKQNELKKSKKKKKTINKEGNGNELQNEFKLQGLIDKIEEVLDNDEETKHNDNKIRKKKKNPTSTVVDTDNSQIKFKREHQNSTVQEPLPLMDGIADENDNEHFPEKISKSKIKKKRKSPKKELDKPVINEIAEASVTDNTNSDEVKKNKLTKKRKYIDYMEETAGENVNSDIVENMKQKSETEKKNIKKNKKAKIKNNVDVKIKKTGEMTEDDIKRINKKKEKKLKQLENKKKKKAELKEKALREQQNENMIKRKLPKERDDKEHKRRKPNTQIETININGVDIDIDYYDGFPVKKEDAERLRKLKKEMISKGIPKSEVQVSLKLERRKAEKALTREKKKVCFNCRKSGHVLSECPDLNETSQQAITGTGICFKCGSTEHTHFECKVVRNDNFKYATCFICREQGHISRQCPDNQRGLYPKGGACRECGDVTHLKKDCPKFQEKQESHSIKLGTLEFSNVEDLPDTNRNIRKQDNKSRKIVKF